MKICVTSEGKTLESQVDPRFGRCSNFILVDTETGAFDAVENPNAGFSGGAGLQSGQLMTTRGVQAVLTGNVGPNAFKVLEAAGIRILTGVSGTVASAIEKFKNGTLHLTDHPTVNSKSGTSIHQGGGGHAGKN